MINAKGISEKYKRMSLVSKATIWFMACSFLQKGLSFITTPIFTRLLTTEQFGLYSVYTSWMQILLIISTLRLDYGVFNKGMSKYQEDRDGYASSMLGFTTIITTVMFAGYLVFRNQINAATELSTILMVALFAELYVSAAVNFWSLRERYDFHYKAVVLYTLLMAVCSSVFGVVAVLAFEEKGAARILSNALIHVLGGIVIYYLLFKRGKKFLNFGYVKFALLFNIPLIPHYFSTYIIEQSDRIMIQKLVNLDAAALYSVAYTVGGLVKIFTAAVTNTLIPLQYRWLEKKEIRTLNKNIIVLMLGVVCLLGIVALAGPEIVLVLGGEKYMPAINVIPPVAASVFYSFLYNVLANVEFYYGKNKFAMKISIVGALVNFVLNLIMIPVFGFVAAAYTTMISYMIFTIGHLVYVNHIFKREENCKGIDSKTLLAMGGASTVVCILIGFLYNGLLLRVILAFVIIVIVIWKRKLLLGILKKKTGD